jgi:hypothetical protein
MLNRQQLIDNILEYFKREYCESGGGIEMLVTRMTTFQLDLLHDDFIHWFGKLDKEAA